MSSPPDGPFFTREGGPAFPAEGGSDSGLYAHPGLSARDYFAAKAAAAIAPEYGGINPGSDMSRSAAEKIAQRSYEIADALLAERAKEQKP